jgi:hypothetical protein
MENGNQSTDCLLINKVRHKDVDQKTKFIVVVFVCWKHTTSHIHNQQQEEEDTCHSHFHCPSDSHSAQQRIDGMVMVPLMRNNVITIVSSMARKN